MFPFTVAKATELAGLQRTLLKKSNYRLFVLHREPKGEGLCSEEVIKKEEKKTFDSPLLSASRKDWE